MEEKWMSINDYSRSFAISDMTVRRRIRTGKLKAVLRDGKYFIHVPPGHAPFAEADYGSAPKLPSVPEFIPPPPPAGQLSGAQAARSHGAEYRHVPPHLAASIATRDAVTVAATDLLAFCEGALKRFADFERRIVAENHSKMQALQQEINAKNLELKQLKQQVEDLQVLVNLMESRRGS
ncbi:MAG: hypothetical protein RIQ81_1696 [Pseudomonadota bacterium]|jgi:hypothetical protein